MRDKNMISKKTYKTRMRKLLLEEQILKNKALEITNDAMIKEYGIKWGIIK